MGHVPPDVLRAFRVFLDFCYLVRRDVIDEDTLAQIQDALDSFHRYQVVFLFVCVRPNGFSLPWQHSLAHYQHLIRLFSAPNGICTSITESMHRKAIKKPYQRTNQCNALGQVLIVNQRDDHICQVLACELSDARRELRVPVGLKSVQRVSVVQMRPS